MMVDSTLDHNEDIQLHFLSEADDLLESSRNTDTLRQYIENECYCTSEWCIKLMFPASLDRQTFEKIDII